MIHEYQQYRSSLEISRLIQSNERVQEETQSLAFKIEYEVSAQQEAMIALRKKLLTQDEDLIFHQRRIIDLEASRAALKHDRSQRWFSEMESSNAQIDDLKLRMTELQRKYSSLATFNERRDDIESQIQTLKDELASNRLKFESRKEELEKKNMLEKEALKREMLRRIKETKLTLLSMTQDTLHPTTKRTQQENEQMTAELAYQSRECEKLAQSNRLLGVEVSRLEDEICIKTENEHHLATRTQFYQKVIKKLTEKSAASAKLVAEHQASADEQSNFTISFASEELVKSLRVRFEELQLSLSHSTNVVERLTAEFQYQKDLHEVLLSSQDIATNTLLSCLEDARSSGSSSVIESFNSMQRETILNGFIRRLHSYQSSSTVPLFENSLFRDLVPQFSLQKPFEDITESSPPLIQLIQSPFSAVDEQEPAVSFRGAGSRGRGKFILDQILPFLAPRSLAVNQKAPSSEELRIAAILNAESIVEPGDLILVRTPGSLYTFFRSLTGSSYDHIAVVLNNQVCLHVGPPTVRYLNTARLLVAFRQPLILRPQLTASARAAFVAACHRLVGSSYDIARVYGFMARLSYARYFGPIEPLDMAPVPAPLNERQRWICSDAVLFLLLEHFRELRNEIVDNLPSSIESHSIEQWKRLAREMDVREKQLNQAPVSQGAARTRIPFSYTSSFSSGRASLFSWLIGKKSETVVNTQWLDYPIYGSSTLNDVEVLFHRRPDLLKLVQLPPSLIFSNEAVVYRSPPFQSLLTVFLLAIEQVLFFVKDVNVAILHLLHAARLQVPEHLPLFIELSLIYVWSLSPSLNPTELSNRRSLFQSQSKL